MAIFLTEPDYGYVVSLLRRCLQDEECDRPELLRSVMSILCCYDEHALLLCEIPFKPRELMFSRYLWIPDDTQYRHFSGSYWAVGWIKLHPAHLLDGKKYLACASSINAKADVILRQQQQRTGE